MYVNSPKALASFVREQRKIQRVSQGEAAAKVGMRQATVSEFENKPDTTSIETVFKLLNSLGLEVHILPKGTTSESNLSGEDLEW
ncbi:helix-turn-helix domain-containing protein [Vibrio breoganii]|uniref:helix-turn-helix domain-containing protein n=1 Tax=Vibrio breoganii TaxID=553239 RepID=UPI000C83CF7A|nr:helix-turn-helix domain-containing protein [Vibrio breoganii]PML85190.1 XRE family transcriptional regulator [Vibrio breoganii]